MSRSATVDKLEKNRNRNSEDASERDEIPQSGKTQNEDQRAANRKEQPHKIASHRKLVHADTGMTIFGHETRPLLLIIPPVYSELK